MSKPPQFFSFFYYTIMEVPLLRYDMLRWTIWMSTLPESQRSESVWNTMRNLWHFDCTFGPCLACDSARLVLKGVGLPIARWDCLAVFWPLSDKPLVHHSKRFRALPLECPGKWNLLSACLLICQFFVLVGKVDRFEICRHVHKWADLFFFSRS